MTTEFITYSKFVSESTAWIQPLKAPLMRTPEGFYYLYIPDSVIFGYLSLLKDLGAKPPSVAHKGPNEVGAHISVILKDETTPEIHKLLEPDLGSLFEYEIHGLHVCDPAGWEHVEFCWFLRCECPQIETLRVSVGLPPTINNSGHDPHITVGIKEKYNAESSSSK